MMFVRQESSYFLDDNPDIKVTVLDSYEIAQEAIPASVIAHSSSKVGSREEQSWVEHAHNVSILASDSAPNHLKGAAAYIGFWHDLGKIAPDFQAYLRGNGKSVDHKWLGSMLAFYSTISAFPKPDSANQVLHNDSIKSFDTWTDDKKTRFILSFVIACHHGGLRSPEKWRRFIRDLTEDTRRTNQCIQVQENNNLVDLTKDNFPCVDPLADVYEPHTVEMTIRMLFSCLVNADNKDTAIHFNGSKQEPLPSIDEMHKAFEEEYEKEISKQNPNKPINICRTSFARQAIDKVESPAGFYQLDLPTGGGKTYTSMRFALEHAKHNKMNQVIVTVPYLTITDQNAAAYKKAFGEKEHGFLEHHSGFDLEKSFKEDQEKDESIFSSSLEEAESQYLQAINTWEHPVIVTTFVQLVSVISGYKTKDARRLHKLANSVIIIDEVQTVPHLILPHLIDMLGFLVRKCNTTVLFCTATQPSYAMLQPVSEPVCNLLKDVPHIVEEDKDNEIFDRVEYRYDNKEKTSSQIASELSSLGQALCIVNTRQVAQDIFYECQNMLPKHSFHLSTTMTKAHRDDVLNQVKQCLKAELPVVLISTQLIEAGVELDFPYVFREIGPLERVIQAGGRCNREGNNKTKGITTVFHLDTQKGPPGEYQITTKVAQKMLRKHGADALNDQKYLKQYMQKAFEESQTSEQNLEKLQKCRENYQFVDIFYAMKLIPDNTVPVLIESRVPQELDDYVITLKTSSSLPSQKNKALRKLRNYMVSIPKCNIEKYGSSVVQLDSDYELYIWNNTYDSSVGISLPSNNKQKGYSW